MENNIAVLDLGGTFLKYGYGNQPKGLVYENKIKVEDKTQKGIYDILEEAVHLCTEVSSNSIKSIVICSPGCVNSVTGEIIGNTPNLPAWRHANPKKHLSKVFGLPVEVENDANLMALGESYHYPGQSVLGITIGTGIGSGFIDKGKIFSGSSFSALEVGHTIVDIHGRQCKCGKKGCVEAYASQTGIIEQVLSNSQQFSHLTISEILELGNVDLNIRQIIEFSIEILAVGIANAVTILNPDVVVIGGGLIENDNYPYQQLEKRVLNNLLDEHKKGIKIRKAKALNKAALWGGIILMTGILE